MHKCFISQRLLWYKRYLGFWTIAWALTYLEDSIEFMKATEIEKKQGTRRKANAWYISSWQCCNFIMVYLDWKDKKEQTHTHTYDWQTAGIECVLWREQNSLLSTSNKVVVREKKLVNVESNKRSILVFSSFPKKRKKLIPSLFASMFCHFCKVLTKVKYTPRKKNTHRLVKYMLKRTALLISSEMDQKWLDAIYMKWNFTSLNYCYAKVCHWLVKSAVWFFILTIGYLKWL